jgi:hypothetical protein
MPQGSSKKRRMKLRTTIMLIGCLEVIAGWIRMPPEHRVIVRELIVTFLHSSWELAVASF